MRVVMIPSFNINQVFFGPPGKTLNGPNFVGGGLKPMPKAMVRAWLEAAKETAEGVEATGQADETPGGAMQRSLLLGGRWDPGLLWRHMLELRESDPGTKEYLDGEAAGAAKASL